ncbi:heavy metal translocating P-type ATPase [Brevibacterium daeguense]|uniref:Heavy metal translocating P-type ATPase n=1 Tax=Brevibacterium daeguense TaxID=909936 RepID=A0ABP8EMD1_9MICO|nr:heavy metal translocating P-type ATPase [Brevibacterium daeguense]
MKVLRFFRRYPLVALALLALAAALILLAVGQPTAAQILATAVIAFVVLHTGWGMIKDILASHWGLDILAVVAMVSTMLVGEYIAGLIIVLMLTGGEALEDLAATRAGRELDALISRAPQFANRIEADGQITQIPVGEAEVGDELLVRPAEVVPVDGVLVSEHASIDESSLTGEPLPVTKSGGEELYSGTVNGTSAFTLRATASAADSQYAAIVELVSEAVESKAPLVRLADRYAVPFTVVSLLIAAIAWAVSGDPVRFAEVLVVATPCPLLIAAPVAFMGGMSRAARSGVIVKNGGALEVMARVRSAAFDKTGTLTRGRATVQRVLPHEGSADELLTLAAAVERYSTHVFAQSIIEAARARGLDLPDVAAAEEIATNGVRARDAGGSEIRVGKPAFVAEVIGEFDRAELESGETAVYISRADRLAGVIVLSDPPRPEAAATVATLRRLGVGEILMVTGDVESTAESVAQDVGVDLVHAEATPQSKVEIVAGMAHRPVVMVGDGINDAPVLAAAEVGIAMGARGATAASESASAVITTEDLSAVARVVDISQHTVRMALQSIWLGIAISVGLMLVAAFGFLPAVVGAILQEGVDLVAILGALRALGGPELRLEDPQRDFARPARV